MAALIAETCCHEKPPTSPRWFAVLAGIAYLQHNYKRYHSGSMSAWRQDEPFVCARLAYFEDCARVLQTHGRTHVGIVVGPCREQLVCW